MRNFDAASSALGTGLRYQQQGNLADAERIYRQVLSIQPEKPDALNLLGIVLCQTGRAPEAVPLMRMAVALSPRIAAYRVNLGNALRAAGLLEDAVRCLREAVRLDPRSPDARYNFGLALDGLGRSEEAASAYARACELGPDAAYRLNLGNALAAARRWDEAARAYQAAIDLEPSNAVAYHGLGRALRRLDRGEDAIAAHEQGLAADPGHFDGFIDYGMALRASGRTDQAIAAYEAALRIRPDSAIAAYNLGNALHEQERHVDAIHSFQRAAALDPSMVEIHLNMGHALRRLGRHSEALECARHAIRLRLEYKEAQCLAGDSLKAMYRYTEALRAYDAALRISPDYHAARLARAGALIELGRIPEGLTEYDTVASAVTQDAVEVVGAHASAANYSDAHHLESLRDLHLNYGSALANRSNQSRRLPPDTDPGRRLRIGYVSADFRKHSVHWFLEPVLAAHDRDSFELYAFYNHTDRDEVTGRLRAAFDHWSEVSRLRDNELAKLITDQRIDILVDLSGQTDGNRLPAFAHRLAPVQMTWLGYPTTTGLDTMDYRITDHQVDPEGYEAWQSERPLRLEGCYLCYGAPREAGDVAPLPDGPIRFGCFNNLAKISPTTLATWARLLQQVPGSKLLVKSRPLADSSVREAFAARFAALGVDTERLELVGWDKTTGEHLARYDAIHVALDTWPYNGVTTTCEALWMGIPVVSQVGTTHASRQGLTILSAVGLPELVARSPDEYVTIAKNLVTDRARLGQLRTGLRARMIGSSLTDPVSFARKLEGAYRMAWHEYRACTA